MIRDSTVLQSFPDLRKGSFEAEYQLLQADPRIQTGSGNEISWGDCSQRWSVVEPQALFQKANTKDR